MLSVGLVMAACGGSGDESGPEDDVTVIATTTILGDIVTNLVGASADVEVLMPIGADPHDFQASAAQVARLNEASLVIANGLGLEEGLSDVLEAAEADGVRVFEIAPLLDPLSYGEVPTHESEAEEHNEPGSYDPHVWFDPLRMSEAARLIASRLDVIAPTVDWMAQADIYAARLLEADGEIASTLSSIPPDRRRLVTNHDSLGYLADRYDLEVVGTVIPSGSTLANPSSEQLAELIGVMKAEGVNVVFAETTQPELLANAIAAELGEAATVVELYTGSLGEPGAGADTLIGLLRTNALRIAGALGD